MLDSVPKVFLSGLEIGSCKHQSFNWPGGFRLWRPCTAGWLWNKTHHTTIGSDFKHQNNRPSANAKASYRKLWSLPDGPTASCWRTWVRTFIQEMLSLCSETWDTLQSRSILTTSAQCARIGIFLSWWGLIHRRMHWGMLN